MRVLLTRHGETKENKKGVLQGWLPGHLSAKGKEQAKLLGKKLSDVKIDRVYTSDLSRCYNTALEILKKHPKTKLIKDRLLRERNLGDFEGKKVKLSDWEVLPGNLYTNRPKGGETFEEVWERMNKFYKKLKRVSSSKTVLIVGHGGSQILLQGIIQKFSLKKSFNLPVLENTAITEIDLNKKGISKMIKINCKEHLKK
jgi:broad specificity phosphatase PhoE